MAFDAEGDSLMAKFESAGLMTSVAFHEYSNNMPHDQYTVGLMGHLPGPNFYISLIDNKRNHGPDRGTGVGLPDPCVATVVFGLETINLIRHTLESDFGVPVISHSKIISLEEYDILTRIEEEESQEYDEDVDE